MTTTTKSSAAEEIEHETPDKTWTPDDLAGYAKARLAASRADETQAIKLGRRSALEAYRAGHALALARDKLPHGKWTPWQKKHGLAVTSVWEAIQIYEGAGSEEAVKGLTIGEARARWVKPKKGKPKVAAEKDGEKQTEAGAVDETEDEPEVVHPNDDEGRQEARYGSITIHKVGAAVATVAAELWDESLKCVSPLDMKKSWKLLVRGSFDREARAASARGVVVLVVPGLDPRFRT